MGQHSLKALNLINVKISLSASATVTKFNALRLCWPMQLPTLLCRVAQTS